MNFRHLIALLKLRWQLSRNQLQKSGTVNQVFFWILLAVGLVSILSMFLGALGAGIAFLPLATADHLLITWTIIIGALIGFWLISLMVELQHSEWLSLEKLLHLPVSLHGAFCLNYVSSFFNLTFVFFIPLMVGLTLAMLITRGLAMAWAPILLVSLLFFVTTVTYQFRGWLGRLMQNKRTRGTIIAFVTIVFVMVSLLPSYLSSRSESHRDRQRDQEAAMVKTRELNNEKDLREKLAAGEITQEEVSAATETYKQQNVDEKKSRRTARRLASFQILVQYMEAIDVGFPPGWVPLGIAAADKGNSWPAVWGTLGLCSLACASLWMSYGSAMRGFRRENRRTWFGGRSFKLSATLDTDSSLTRSAETVANRKPLVARQLPILSESQTAVALASFQSLLRAPESKMALILPLIMGIVLMPLLSTSKGIENATSFHDYIPLAAFFGVLFGMSQIAFNIFAGDRDGFRAYVLSPVARRDILIGKNVAVGFLVAALSVSMLITLRFFVPLNLTALVASLIQLPIGILLFSLIGNWISILFPVGISRGSMKPVQLKISTALIQLVAMSLSCLIFAPATSLIGIEFLVGQIWGIAGWPIYLVGSVLELIAVIWIYRWLIAVQGRWLQQREIAVLEAVSNVPE